MIDLNELIDKIKRAYVKAYKYSAFSSGSFVESIYVDRDGRVYIVTESPNSHLGCVRTGDCIHIASIRWGWGYHIEGLLYFEYRADLLDYFDNCESDKELCRKALEILEREGEVFIINDRAMDLDEVLDTIVKEIAIEEFLKSEDDIWEKLEGFFGSRFR